MVNKLKSLFKNNLFVIILPVVYVAVSSFVTGNGDNVDYFSWILLGLFCYYAIDIRTKDKKVVGAKGWKISAFLFSWFALCCFLLFSKSIGEKSVFEKITKKVCYFVKSHIIDTLVIIVCICIHMADLSQIPLIYYILSFLAADLILFWRFYISIKNKTRGLSITYGILITLTTYYVIVNSVTLISLVTKNPDLINGNNILLVI